MMTKKIGTQEIENVNEFRYLRELIDSDRRSLKEIKIRIGMEKNAFFNLSLELRNRTMNLDLRKRIMQCYL